MKKSNMFLVLSVLMRIVSQKLKKNIIRTIIQTNKALQTVKTTSKTLVLLDHQEEGSKKELQDYYYGDDIFSKPKNGKKNEKTTKRVNNAKTRKKQKHDKSRKVASITNGNGKLSIQASEKASKSDGNTIKISCDQNEMSSKEDGNKLFESISQFASQLTKEEVEMANRTQNKHAVQIAKPIPQRHKGSNFGVLMNAVKISDSKPSLASSDSTKKRDDKALNK